MQKKEWQKVVFEAYNSVGKSMRLISAKSVVQVYLSLSYYRTFSLKVKRTAHNGNDVGSSPTQFIYFLYLLKSYLKATKKEEHLVQW